MCFGVRVHFWDNKMAASGKKSKPKWVKMEVETTAKRATLPNWVEECDREIDSESYNIFKNEVVLPTAPRASRATQYDESKIPPGGPYQIYVTNIPYDLTEESLTSFFQGLRIKNVNMPRDDRGGSNKARGFAYLTFEDKASLLGALTKTDTVINGRNLNIELSTNDSGGRGGMNRGGRGNRDGGGRNDMGGGVDRTSSNWRTGPRSDDFQERSSNYDRGYNSGRREFSSVGGGGGGGNFRGNFDREERGGYFREDRERGFDRERHGGGRDGDRRDGGFNYERDRGFSRGGEERSFGGDRDNRGFNRGRDDREDRFSREDRGNSSGQWRDEPRTYNKFEERPSQDRERDQRYNSRRDDYLPPDKGNEKGAWSSSSSVPLKERPKLKLLPKSNAAPATNGPAPTQSANSIFGGAKPVDTAAREREIEDRLMKSSEDSDSRSGPGSVTKDSDSEKKRTVTGPPKENPWTRNKPPSDVVNNGRATPEESNFQTSTAPSVSPVAQEDNRDSNRSWGRNQPRNEQKRNVEEPKWGKGPQNKPLPANISDRPKGSKDEKQFAKQRDAKKDSIDDYSKMPKVQESAVPNFAGSNKYSTLGDSDENPTE